MNHFISKEEYKIYSNAAICNVKKCLNVQSIYCMADTHLITPNTTECEKYLGKQDAK